MEKMKLKDAAESVLLPKAGKDFFQNSTQIREAEKEMRENSSHFRRFTIDHYLPLYQPTSTSTPQPMFRATNEEYSINSTSQPMFQSNEDEDKIESDEVEL